MTNCSGNDSRSQCSILFTNGSIASIKYLRHTPNAGQLRNLSSVITGAIPTQPSPQHHIHPRSVNLPSGQKKTWPGNTRVAVEFFKRFRFDVLESVEGNETVVIHTRSSATMTSGCSSRNEYVLFFHLAKQDKGEYKISSSKEFADSLYSLRFFAEERKRQQALGRGFAIGII
ncbi:unnamed protein product [Somion occarium]|uniref:Uncharacterized protein n=1 Tax=Somion occarium TaxID=3059160 RepID=A0ABP1EBS3_9APHY